MSKWCFDYLVVNVSVLIINVTVLIINVSVLIINVSVLIINVTVLIIIVNQYTFLHHRNTMAVCEGQHVTVRVPTPTV